MVAAPAAPVTPARPGPSISTLIPVRREARGRTELRDQSARCWLAPLLQCPAAGVSADQREPHGDGCQGGCAVGRRGHHRPPRRASVRMTPVGPDLPDDVKNCPAYRADTAVLIRAGREPSVTCGQRCRGKRVVRPNPGSSGTGQRCSRQRRMTATATTMRAAGTKPITVGCSATSRSPTISGRLRRRVIARESPGPESGEVHASPGNPMPGLGAVRRGSD